MHRRSIQLGSAAILLATVLGAGCGPAVPPRYVVEGDFVPYTYRRYQEVLDVEFPVEGNPASGHTASYVDRSGDELYIATAFVSVYERPDSLTAEVRDYLSNLNTYEVEIDRIDGEYLWRLTGDGDNWLVWVSGRYVVKLGSIGREVPAPIIERYLGIFDSDLDSGGNARSGADSAGPSHREQEESQADQLRMPSSLR